jgi:hypothetical protein
MASAAKTSAPSIPPLRGLLGMSGSLLTAPKITNYSRAVVS